MTRLVCIFFVLLLTTSGFSASESVGPFPGWSDLPLRVHELESGKQAQSLNAINDLEKLVGSLLLDPTKTNREWLSFLIQLLEHYQEKTRTTAVFSAPKSGKSLEFVRTQNRGKDFYPNAQEWNLALQELGREDYQQADSEWQSTQGCLELLKSLPEYAQLSDKEDDASNPVSPVPLAAPRSPIRAGLDPLQKPQAFVASGSPAKAIAPSLSGGDASGLEELKRSWGSGSAARAPATPPRMGLTHAERSPFQRAKGQSPDYKKLRRDSPRKSARTLFSGPSGSIAVPSRDKKMLAGLLTGYLISALEPLTGESEVHSTKVSARFDRGQVSSLVQLLREQGTTLPDRAHFDETSLRLRGSRMKGVVSPAEASILGSKVVVELVLRDDLFLKTWLGPEAVLVFETWSHSTKLDSEKMLRRAVLVGEEVSFSLSELLEIEDDDDEQGETEDEDEEDNSPERELFDLAAEAYSRMCDRSLAIKIK